MMKICISSLSGRALWNMHPQPLSEMEQRQRGIQTTKIWTTEIIEIKDYVEKGSDIKKNVKSMHDKLMSLMKFYHYEGKGALPFVFGKDVHKLNTENEINHVSKA